MVDINPQIIEAEIAQIGPQGIPGQAATITIGSVTTGAAGSSATVTNSGTSTAAVLDFTIPQGAKGAQGEQGQQGIQGLTGATGNGISSIDKIDTSGLVDTYRITLTDNTHYDFTVTNGSSISDIEKTGTSGLVDTYTITLTNGNTHTFTVTNGAEGEKGETGDVGNGILNILKMSTTGLVDNYRINFTNGTYFDFDVTNALSIQSIAKLSTSGLVDTYRITFNDSTYFDFPVTNGKGVTGVTLLSWEGLDKTYRMSFNDGTYFDYVVTNGTGQVDWGGITGILSQQADLQEALDSKANMSQTHALKAYSDNGEYLYDAEGLLDVKNYAHSSFDASKFTVVGSPVITSDGIASGFSSSNYLKTNLTFTPASQLKFVAEFTTGNDITSNQNVYRFYNNLTGSYETNAVKVQNGNIFVFGGEGKSVSWAAETNKTYKVELEWTSSVGYYVAKLTKYDGTVLTQNMTTATTPMQASNSLIGIGNGVDFTTLPFLGSINLKYFSITVDGVPVFSGNKTGIDTIKDDDYTVVGTPTISDDGIASGFSSSNYLTKLLSTTATTSYREEIVFTTSSDVTTYQVIKGLTDDYTGLRVKLRDNSSIEIDFANNSSTSWNVWNATSLLSPVSANTTYKIILSWNGTKYTTEIYSNNVLLNSLEKNSSNPPSMGTFVIGNSAQWTYNRPFLGSIDLNSFKIYVDDNLVYQPCLKIPYTSGNFQYGGKYVNYIYRDRVQDAYEQGLSNEYFTLQEDNVGNYSVIGSPTISSDYVASGFGGSNYLTGIASNNITLNNLDVYGHFNLTSLTSAFEGVYTVGDTQNASDMVIQLGVASSGKLGVGLHNDTTWGGYYSTNDITVNTNYYYHLYNSNGTIKADISTNNVDWTNWITVSGISINSSYTSNKVWISTSGQNYFNGSINLKQIKNYVNGNLVYQAVTPPCFTLPTGQIYGRFAQTLRNSTRSGINRSFLYSDRTQWLTGSCTSGTEVTLARPFSDSNYMLSVPYSAKSATAFTPTQTGDWFAIGEGAL